MTYALFKDFSPTDKAAWITQAIKDLKGKDFDQNLKSLLWGEIEIQPFYTQEDIANLPEGSREIHSSPAGLSSRDWVNFVPVYFNTSNLDILNALANGATGLILHLKGDENLAELLKEVMPSYISVLIKPYGDPAAVLKQYLSWVEQTGTDEAELTGGLLWSPVDVLFDEEGSWEAALLTFNQVFAISPNSHQFRSFFFDFSRYAESGASGLDELIFGFGEVIELIAQSGLDPQLIFDRSGVVTAVGDSHFPEIAKVKTIRFFMSELALQYGFELDPLAVFCIAKTSTWSKSILDPNSNLIRQTYEALAAVLGGVNGLWVAPLQADCTEPLDARIARNVSLILSHESYLDKVADPVAGSYYLDFLMRELFEKLKSGLQQLEAAGGWKVAFDGRQIHQKVRESRLNQQKQILEGERSKIGVNKYPASEKLKKDLSFSPIEDKIESALSPSRATYLVELQKQQGV